MLNWLRRKFGQGSDTLPAESDTGRDPNVARTRASGGEPGHDEGDAAGTTGPGESETFVGRVAGQDEGFAGQTGAEVRAEEERKNT